MEYKVVLCLLLIAVVAYADEKEEKVDAAVSLEDNLTLFDVIAKMHTCLRTFFVWFDPFGDSPLFQSNAITLISEQFYVDLNLKCFK